MDDISYSKIQDLSYGDICQILHIDKNKLRTQLKKIEPHVQQILSKFPLKHLGILKDNNWSEEHLMKMVIILMDILATTSKNSRCILKIGYYVECQNFTLKFLDDKIAVCSNKDVTVEPFSIISIPLKIGLNSTSEIYFEQNTDLTQFIAS